MAEAKTPVDQALDLLVYAPLGLLFSARELIPELAQRGRQQLTNQVGMARLVGQFAVKQGTVEAEKALAKAREQAMAKLGDLMTSGNSETTPAPAEPAAEPPVVAGEPASDPVVVVREPAADPVDPADDVEADLDTILKDRLVVVADEEDEDEDEPVDAEDRSGETTKVRPRAPGEFVCQSCFLVKHPSQLADADKQFCRDCV